ncbi:MAG: glycosyltransferase [Anaerolineales bacterium]
MMANNDKVSIVLPTLNGAKFIRQSIESCRKQSHSNIELIVVDGGSTDGTLEIVQQINDPRIRVVHQHANVDRLPGALNIGFAQVSGEYFTWTQDDDYFSPNAIEILVGQLKKNPEVDFVYSGLWLIDESGEIIGEPDLLPAEALYWTNPIGHCFLYTRAVANQVGLYDPEYFMAEDVHYWMKTFQRVRMMRVPDRLYYHRWHDQSLTIKIYGNYYAARLAARARRDIFRISRRQYLSQISSAYVMEAFAARSNGDLERVRKCALLGLLTNPGWLRNRGVVSIAVESLVGSRRLHELRRRLMRRFNEDVLFSLRS